MVTLFLIVIYAAFISLGLPDSLLGVAWPVAQKEFGASLGDAGIISMVISVGTVISSLFSSKLLKRFGVGKVTAVSVLMTALALLVSYVNIVQENTTETLNFTLTSPTVLVGMFVGAMLTFVFSAFTMSAVQKAAQSIVVEVRRQFREIAGIMEGKADPEYAKCVSLCTKGALHEMVAPALMAIIVPILTGLILGPTGVVGLLGGVSVTGFAMAVFMSNAGGAWDNAKKYIEGGHHGGKGSECHKAAVVGDTVGDPFKDTSGPSLNILIKLCSTVSIVFSGLIVAFNLMNLL